jgi:hypothetical protein
MGNTSTCFTREDEGKGLGGNVLGSCVGIKW